MPKNQGKTETEDIDYEEVIEDATPAVPWSDEFIERLSEGRTKDCGLMLDLPTVTFQDPTLGELQGLDEAEDVVQQLDDLLSDIVNIMRSNLPERMNDELDEVFGPYTAPDSTTNPLPFDLDLLPFDVELGVRIGILIGKVASKIADMPTHFPTETANQPDPVFSPKKGKISIRVNDDMDDVGIRIYSRMESTYSFRRNEGTSYGSQNTIISSDAYVDDRSWFAKALIPEKPVETHGGNPYPMPKSHGYLVAQLGVNEDSNALHYCVVDLTTLGHGIDIPVFFNRNYGRVRVILVPSDDKCQIEWGEIEAIGPFEEDIQDREETRFSDIETKRDEILQSLSDLQAILAFLGSAAGVIPVFGSLIGTGLSRLRLLINDKKKEFADGLNQANGQQNHINLTLAESYPEKGPVGGREDNDLP